MSSCATTLGAKIVMVLVATVLFAVSARTPTAASAAVLGEGWLPGPGAVGENTYSGVIDEPAVDARVTRSGALQLAGWFVDRTAEGWAGADDVEIYLGTMGNGGALLSHAFSPSSVLTVCKLVDFVDECC